MARRALEFCRRAQRVTQDPTFELVVRPCEAVRRRVGVPDDEWARWAGASVEAAHAPPWAVLARAAHARTDDDARAALDELAVPFAARPDARLALPLFTLATHALARFALVALVRPVAEHVRALPPRPHDAFYFNALLHALARFDRSRAAADAAADVLAAMHDRALPVSPATERVLVRDDFGSPRLLGHFHRTRPPTPALAQARLRAYASLRSVDRCAHYMDAIATQCLLDRVPPPYSTEHARGTPHVANTHYLRALRDDRRSAFRYFHRLLQLDLAHPRPSLSTAKSNVDVYDWTTALCAAAHDRTLSAAALLDLFRATRDGTYRPTRATYTVVIQGLLWKNALGDAERLWDEFIRNVVRAQTQGDHDMRIDRKALCVGTDVLVQSGRAEEALYLLDEAVKRDAAAPDAPSKHLKVHPIHALLSALLRVRRPDAVFFVWTHLSSLYHVPPTNLMLRLLLKAAMQASKMDAESLKGAMSWYMADNALFQTTVTGPDTPTRDALAARLRTLLQTPAPPSVVGIWANRRSTEVARSIFRGMILGNWPALRGAAGCSGGVTRARAKGDESVFQELARVLAGRPHHFLPPHPASERPTTARPDVADERLGPPLPTVMPTESTFAAYVALLGLSSRAREIPEALAWMRALGVMPKTETLAVALVFWMEVGLRGPVFEDGWGGSASEGGTVPRTEYGALRAWIRGWVGEERAPTEADVYAGIKRVREMRDGKRVKSGIVG